MKKHIIDLRVEANEPIGNSSVLLCLSPIEGHLPECRPGQFAQLRVDAPNVFLRRPISIHDVADGKIWFLVQLVGDGTRWLGQLHEGDTLNAVLPLGNGFSVGIQNSKLKIQNEAPTAQFAKPLLVGGGVGVAPLLYLGRKLREQGIRPTFLLGARTASMLLRLDAFQTLGEVFVTTEDGSLGEKGFVTQHSILDSRTFDIVQTCGPTPMMKAVAKWAAQHNVRCEVSLENRMACGIGACLCCVQKTTEGHKCVCTDGPVFEAPLLTSPEGKAW